MQTPGSWIKSSLPLFTFTCWPTWAFNVRTQHRTYPSRRSIQQFSRPAPGKPSWGWGDRSVGRVLLQRHLGVCGILRSCNTSRLWKRAPDLTTDMSGGRLGAPFLHHVPHPGTSLLLRGLLRGLSKWPPGIEKLHNFSKSTSPFSGACELE